MRSLGVLAAAMLVLAGCQRHTPGPEDLTNVPAQLKGTLPYPVLSWHPVTTSVDREQRLTRTLFQNDEAAGAPAAGEASSYPQGAVLGLVTWQQRDDPHWFGARIPANPIMVEFVSFAGDKATYRRFAGNPLTEQPEPVSGPRIAAITAMTPVQLP